jgi:hypothetical protein
MQENPRPSPLPDELLKHKGEILEQWGQLPPEHQATMALVLFQQTLEGEYGPWLRSAIQIMTHQEPDEPFRFLPIVRISQSHLKQANLTDEEIGQLDEEDLMSISHEIVRHYTNDVFWEELEFVARKTLEDKQHK